MKIRNLALGDPTLLYVTDEARAREGFVFLAAGIDGLRGRCVSVEATAPPTLRYIHAPAYGRTVANRSTLFIGAVMAAIQADLISERELQSDSPEQLIDAWDAYLSGAETPSSERKRESQFLEDVRFHLRSAPAGLIENRDGFMRIHTGPVRLSAPVPLARTLDLFRRQADGRNPLTSIKSGGQIKVIETPAAIEDLAKRVVDADFEKGIAALGAAIDQDPGTVAWYASSEAVGETRRQAAGAYPVLADEMALKPSLRRVVDELRPLQLALAETTGLSKGALKRLARITSRGIPDDTRLAAEGAAEGEDAVGLNRMRRFAVRGRATTNDIVRVLRDLPPDWVPSSNDQWTAFCEVVSSVVRPLELAGSTRGASLLGSAKGDWVEYRATLARAADLDPTTITHRDLVRTTADAVEVADRLAVQVLLPTALASIATVSEKIPLPRPDVVDQARNCALELILGSAKNGAGALYSVARRWMTRGNVLSDIQSGPSIQEADTWPAIVATYAATNGLQVKCLTSADALREETRRLGHCVGASTGLYQDAYINRARNGACHILSVQSGDGRESFSTIELHMSVTAAEVRRYVVQHQGRLNTRPDPRALATFEEWATTISEGRLTLNTEECASFRDRVRNAREAPGDPSNGWARVLEWNPYVEEQRQAFWDEWKGILGGSWQKSEHPGILFRDAGMRDLVARIAPDAAELLRAGTAAPRSVPARETESTSEHAV